MQLVWCDFGEEEGDVEVDWYGDDYCDDGGDQGVVDWSQGVEFVFDWILVGGEEEVQFLYLQGMVIVLQY